MKQLLAILTLFGSLTFTSCEDFLTEEVRGQQNLDTYFTTADECEAYITGCYQDITCGGWWNINTVWLLSEMCSDDAWMGNTTQSQSDYISLAHYQGNGASNGPISNFWQYRYKGILRCNVAIDRISNTELEDKELQARLVAEARFLRGYFYFELARNFGGVPLITEFKMPEEIQGITRASLENTYKFIEEDLIAAAEVLPKRSEYADADMGRATSGAALGLLGKVYLYQEKWTEARDVLQKLIPESGYTGEDAQTTEYDLLPNFGDVWDKDFDNSVESLFEVQYEYHATLAVGGSLSTVTGARSCGAALGDGWAWCQPTANLEAAYSEDDERREWTIIKTGCTEIKGETEENFTKILNDNKEISVYDDCVEKYNLPANSLVIDPSGHKSGRIIRKYYLPLNDRPEVYNTDKSPLNHRILRYADVLLMYAEACNELSDDTHAQAALNRVRNRAGLSPVSVTENELRHAIRNERRLELAFEQNRLYDIRRWKDDNGKPVIANLMGENGSFVKWNTDPATRDAMEWDNQGEASDKGKSFREDRDLLFPIPLYEVTMSNGSIEQNPNWN
ncbi:RagB/SusD family nutrient uptake outer membrane protein [Phocaeicola plebeius]|mgnify:FL=1|uniref:RagB/SusD family nutrient uptake outer membrane protein n=1 Tax=Phocaeicola plebeius TaxID=310297 RepID=UPI00307CBD11